MVIFEGEIIYDGPPDCLDAHFSDLGFPVDSKINKNPADHVMTLLNSDSLRIENLENNI